MSNNSYVAIAERPAAPGEAWWISFPSFPGVTSAADSAETIVEQARDALATTIEAMQREGEPLPPTVEEGELPAYDLDEYERPLVLLVPTGNLQIPGNPPTVTAA